MGADPFSSALDDLEGDFGVEEEGSVPPAAPDEEVLETSTDTSPTNDAVAAPGRDDTRPIAIPEDADRPIADIRHTKTLADLRCDARIRSSSSATAQCKRLALPGSTRCVEHTLRSDIELDVLHSQVHEQTALDLLDAVPDAVSTLRQITTDLGAPEGVRVKSAEAILDRAGFRSGIEVTVKEEVTVNISEVVRERLNDLRSRPTAIEAVQTHVHPDDTDDSDHPADIVEGEIVDE